jgi:uncharacterized membrane protein
MTGWNVAVLLVAVLPHVSVVAVAGCGGAVGCHIASPPYDEWLKYFLETLIFLANVAGGLVVGVATVRGLLVYMVDLARLRGEEVPKERIRLSLGRALALALEFQLGADILSTALNPSPTDIGVLAAIAILRTALNFFLQRELREEARRQAEYAQRQPTQPEGGAERRRTA